jgi:hypothetical protein
VRIAQHSTLNIITGGISNNDKLTLINKAGIIVDTNNNKGQRTTRVMVLLMMRRRSETESRKKGRNRRIEANRIKSKNDKQVKEQQISN